MKKNFVFMSEITSVWSSNACQAHRKHEETAPHSPTTMTAYSQSYFAEPFGIDRFWQTPLEVYYYLLYNPFERIRLQGIINFYWLHRRRVPVRIYHRCTATIRLFPNTSDQDFVSQLLHLVDEERFVRRRRQIRRQRGHLPRKGIFSHMSKIS